MEGSLEVWWIFIPSSITCCTKLSGFLTSLYSNIWLVKQGCPFTSVRHLGIYGTIITTFNTKSAAQNTQSWSWWSHCKRWGPSLLRDQLEAVKKSRLFKCILWFSCTPKEKKAEEGRGGKKRSTSKGKTHCPRAWDLKACCSICLWFPQ